MDITRAQCKRANTVLHRRSLECEGPPFFCARRVALRPPGAFGPAAGGLTSQPAAGGGIRRQMAARKIRTEAQRMAVLAEIAVRYRAGETQAAIGAALDLTQQQISKYLPQLYALWRTQAAVDIGEKLTQELAKIDVLEAEAWREYERGKLGATRTQTVTEATVVEGADATKTPAQLVKTTKTVEGRLGDPRYLDVIDRCIDRRLRIFGLYAQGESTATVVIKAYNGIDLEQM